MPPTRPSSERFAGVVVAAGRSERFGGPLPKQFEEIAGATLVARSVGALASRPGVDGVVVVLPSGEIGGPREDDVRSIAGVTDVVGGGATRAFSVRRGVTAARGVGFVLVHDAARPLVSAALVDAVIAATLEHGAAVPALEIPDTVKEDDGSGFVERTLERSKLRLAQTPQGARVDWLLEALDHAEATGLEITDEAAALEHAGHRVRLVAGDPGNVKITTREDLVQARRRFGRDAAGFRVGTGFDIHPFAEGRALVLGGVEFAGEPGLLGHSDADVLLHALMDALLGALGLGDIGVHFPPHDARWEGASSAQLARDVAKLVADHGYRIANLDATLLAERPRISPRAAEMRASVAACFGLEPGRVSIKATTLEGLGSLGRAEGIACQAVALVVPQGSEP